MRILMIMHRYTVEELLLLAQSTFPAQRAMACTVLGNIATVYWRTRLQPSTAGSNFPRPNARDDLTNIMIEAHLHACAHEIILVLRYAVEDCLHVSVLVAAIHALHAFLVRGRSLLTLDRDCLCLDMPLDIMDGAWLRMKTTPVFLWTSIDRYRYVCVCRMRFACCMYVCKQR